MKRTFCFYLSATLLLAGSACKKVDFETNTQVNVRLTDAPLNAQQVNIDIKGVMVKVENDSLAWHSLQVNAGVYNLLDFQNGKDTLIASGNVHATSIIKEMRLVLGEQNSIKIADAILPLQMAAGAESGLTLFVDQKLNKSTHELVVDFDASLSIVEDGNDGFLLKPVLKLK